METKHFPYAGCAYVFWASLVVIWAVLLWRWLARYRVLFPADAGVAVPPTSACLPPAPHVTPPAAKELSAPDPLTGWPRPLAWN